MAQQWLNPAGFALLTLALVAVGVWLCGRTAAALGVHDHPAIVWDEIAGYFITLIAAPAGWFWLAVGFVLFRFFDILKPWPANLADRELEGGFGIMMDDVMAAVYAWLAMQSIIVLSGNGF